ncbi:MAG: hypothetical protein LBG83_08810 [Oscillospiraceae bacterium]|jgi:hypothetical protein|nr:hypothetical protein [Oscillospiraceae bacterium]
MPARHCRVILGSEHPRLLQIAAGFSLLHATGELSVTYAGCHPLRDVYPHNTALFAVFDDGAKLIYDLGAYEDIPDEAQYDAALAPLTRCFRLCYLPERHGERLSRRKLRPLGLPYDVTSENNFMRPPKGKAPLPEDYLSHNSYPAYQGLFYTRLYDPADARSDAHAAELERANAHRIACLRACREALGDRLIGGLSPTAYARQQAPELVLPPELAERPAYLRLLKRNFVCVIPEGPEHFPSRKLAEATAAGRALLCPEPYYLLPGGFARRRNFSAYETPEDSARALVQLLDNVPWIHRMEAANYAYHNTYVRPDALVRRTLEDAFGQDEKTDG